MLSLCPSRRTALRGGVGGLAVAGLALTGCDTDDLRPPDADAPVAGSASSAGAPTDDEALVAEAVAAIRSAAVTVVAARLVRPLRRPLAPLLSDHRRHLTTLGEGASATLEPATAPTDSAAALSAVQSAEQGLQQQLVDFAVRAESGTLAALLASMSASVAQHLAALGSTG